MTELDYLEQIQFLAQVGAFALCWIAGCQSLKWIIYIKNHKELW